MPVVILYAEVEPPLMSDNKGLIIVYTGDGKGKTTAALGLALRAAGYKKKVLIVQFGKAWFSGEIEGIKKLAPDIKIVQGGKGFVKILGDELPIGEHKQAARETFDRLYQEVTSAHWDMVIADEINGAVKGKLLRLSQIIQLIKDKPDQVDLVLTGRFAHPQVIAEADLVTEMKSIKHPFEQGLLAKKGIDY